MNISRMILALGTLGVLVSGCNDPGTDYLDLFTEPRVQIFFNEPGSRADGQRNLNHEDILVERINAAKTSVSAALYGFSSQPVRDALVQAHLRGVNVRVAGDAKHFLGHDSGFEELQKHHVPMQVGNQWHIQHNKFFVIDTKIVFVGTGNISPTDLHRNKNNWVIINHDYIAQDYQDEFDQMFEGRFTASKLRNGNPNFYTVGDTKVEVYFSPQEDAMGRILEELEAAENDIHFTIFAFTKDQVGSRFVDKHREFQAWNEENGQSDLPAFTVDDSPMQQKKVVGVYDRSQIHGNFLYHEVYRLNSRGIPSRMDANENSRLPGDYQAGGGRLHSKTMIIDMFGDNPRVITGSFNWSAAATLSNDETMLIFHGRRVAEEYYREFQNMWAGAKQTGQAVCNMMDGYMETGSPLCSTDIRPGDLIISEVMWDGWNSLIDPSDRTGTRDPLDNDEFFEIYNATDEPINLSLFTLNSAYDAKMGFTPGTVIMPGEYFLVLDHNLVTYSDNSPQNGQHAYNSPDFVVNIPNDPRMPRLNLPNSSMYLELRDANGRVIDRVGDGGPPFGGGRRGDGSGIVNYSMERIIRNGDGGDGTQRSSWKTSTAPQGGERVNEAFRDIIIATPGEANSQ